MTGAPQRCSCARQWPSGFLAAYVVKCSLPHEPGLSGDALNWSADLTVWWPQLEGGSTHTWLEGVPQVTQPVPALELATSWLCDFQHGTCHLCAFVGR